MTRMEAVSAILQLKGWEYKARKQEAKLKDKFWDTFMQVYKAKEKPTHSKEKTLYNFINNIMTPSHRT